MKSQVKVHLKFRQKQITQPIGKKKLRNQFQPKLNKKKNISLS